MAADPFPVNRALFYNTTERFQANPAPTGDLRHLAARFALMKARNALGGA